MAGKKDKAKAEERGADQDTLLVVSKALADPKRLELLRRIAGADGSSCMDLRTCMAMNPATLSHHMKLLETAGLIETRRDGKLVRATLRRKAWKNYVAQVKAMTA